MTLSTRNPWEYNSAAIREYPDHVLLDIARNDAAQHDYRKLAVEVLVNRKSPKIKHPDLAPFVHELQIELDGIIFDHPAPGNPLIASITTESLNATENHQNSISPDLAIQHPEAEEVSAETSTPFTGFDGIEISHYWYPQLDSEEVINWPLDSDQMSPSAHAATVRIMDSILKSRVPESAFLRDSDPLDIALKSDIPEEPLVSKESEPPVPPPVEYEKVQEEADAP